MIRRIVGLCLWWLAFTPALSLLHLGYPVAVCLWPVVGLVCIEASIKPIRICGAALFVSGLLAMLYITQDRWLLPPAIWGVLFVLGKELFGGIGEHLQQRLVTGFAADEVLIAFGGILAVDGERLIQLGIEAVQRPVAGGRL